MNNEPGIGRKFVDYVGNNAVSLASTGVVVAGAAALAAAGGKAAVTTGCLVGGGLFAAFVMQEVVKAVIVTGSHAVSGITDKVKDSFKKPSPPPMTRAMPGAPSADSASASHA